MKQPKAMQGSVPCMHCIKYTSKLTGWAVQSVRAISYSNTDEVSLYNYHIITQGRNLQVTVLCVTRIFI